MGKTVPSYRIALEMEIQRWKGFRKALNSEEDREAFETMMDMCRNNATASSNAVNPIIFEPMVMSILLSQLEKIRELENNLHEIFWLRSSAQPEKSQQQQDTPCTDSNKAVTKQIQGEFSGYG
jgi:hypothetical protein